MFNNNKSSAEYIEKAKTYYELLDSEAFRKVLKEIRDEMISSMVKTHFLQKRTREGLYRQVKALDEVVKKLGHYSSYYAQYLKRLEEERTKNSSKF